MDTGLRGLCNSNPHTAVRRNELHTPGKPEDRGKGDELAPPPESEKTDLPDKCSSLRELTQSSGNSWDHKVTEMGRNKPVSAIKTEFQSL